ncbi:ABC transporter permease [Microbacterium marinilacus]|uniref:ABC transporter permease n=1 Tax=Microbacterium marinilacus TaxID=415209 RepID=A0ABP7BRJ1_9MICO|nr:ABC transporter permease [Microbacterium marinilacus]MBY0690410.1 ABC transporter permease [Microbacterium marinilacus]
MIRFLSRRLLELVVVFFGVTFIIYCAVFLLPGDPIAALGGDRPLPETVQQQLREQYGLDLPLWQQYLNYLGGLVQGDLGTTFTGQSVSEQMASRWPTTITLALTAWALTVVISIALGLVAGLRQGTPVDRSVLLGTIIAESVPIFVMGIMAQYLFGIALGWTPIAGVADGWPRGYILPALIIALYGVSGVARLMRGSVVDTMQSDFVRTLRAKGMSRRNIVGLHAMRNAAAPVVNVLAIQLGSLLGGTVVIEAIFNINGVGGLLYRAIQNQEGTLVVGVATTLVFIFLVTNVLVDVLSSVLDPRIRND